MILQLFFACGVGFIIGVTFILWGLDRSDERRAKKPRGKVRLI